MTKLMKITDQFWNIRGSFKIKGLLNIGSHSSLVRLGTGKFIFLDSLELDEKALKEVNKITNDGNDLEAFINLHPFHTAHVEWAHKAFPNAKHYGTERHLKNFPDLKWENLKSEDSKLHEMYSNDLKFSVPRGVEFIPENENLHFSSVLAYHPNSKTMHVDDTFLYINLPKLLKFFGIDAEISFHPTLSRTLEKRPEAADEFKEWAKDLINSWSVCENLCAAHTSSLIRSKVPIHQELYKALKRVESTLEKHRKSQF